MILRHGYRTVLFVNTFLVGLAMASFTFISNAEPLWILVVQLALFGGVNSIQFTAMNTITLKDLDVSTASSGNSLLSMIQMLSMSLAVTSAGALLATFQQLFNERSSSTALPAFHATFICVGLITSASAWIFMQLAPATQPIEQEAAQHIGEL
jgi:hypothetical protein